MLITDKHAAQPACIKEPVVKTEAIIDAQTRGHSLCPCHTCKPLTTLIMNEIIKIPQQGAIAINSAVDKYNTLVVYVKRSLRNELDYGKIPGCGDKPVLFKPGAEKIATLFGLRESIERLEALKDWTGKEFGEPFFGFEYKCTLRDRSGEIIAECVGSCNSWEDKYRWRKAERTCPSCGAAAIKRSGFPDKQTGDKGWYCHSKSGGCNAKFSSKDPSIIDQTAGRVPNERIFDQVNTIDKMAQKRAYVGAVILAANASNFFSVEHTEIDAIDIDYEPAEAIDSAMPMHRVPLEVVDDAEPIGVGEVNRQRIGEISKLTGHNAQQIRAIAAERNLPDSSVELSVEQCRELQMAMLVDFAVTRRRLATNTAYSLVNSIFAQQPNVTDENLINMFWIRLDELAQDAPLASNGRAATVNGVGID